MTHGGTGYRYGCRCEVCRAEHAADVRWWREHRRPQKPREPAVLRPRESHGQRLGRFAREVRRDRAIRLVRERELGPADALALTVWPTEELLAESLVYAERKLEWRCY